MADLQNASEWSNVLNGGRNTRYGSTDSNTSMMNTNESEFPTFIINGDRRLISPFSTPSSSFSKHRIITNQTIPSVMTQSSREVADEGINNKSFRDEPIVEGTDLCSDLIKIEITDLEDSYPPNITIGALRRCNRQVLLPLWVMFQFVGWRSFGVTSVHSGHHGWKYLNIIYTAVIISLTLFAYGYQVLVCQWRLNIQEDTSDINIRPALTTATSISPWNSTTTFTMLNLKIHGRNSITPSSSNSFATSVDDSILEQRRTVGCEHVITTYIVPNVFHFIAFWLGFYHFRIQQNEELFALTEKVFLYCSTLPTCQFIQKNVIFKTRLYLICAFLWIMLTITMHVLYDVTFYTTTDSLNHVALEIETCSMKFAFKCLDALGYISLSAVSAVVILNYGIHCEMIVCFVKTVVSRLRERSLNLNAAIKDIHTVRNALCLLNGTIAHMTALIFLLYCENCILGTSILILNKYNDRKVWTYRIIFVLHSLPALLFSLVQAGRVNLVCKDFRRVALELRAYSYQNSSQLELDSFLLFVTSNKFEAKLFSMAVRPGMLLSLTVAVAFAMLLLIQTGIIGKDTFL